MDEPPAHFNIRVFRIESSIFLLSEDGKQSDEQVDDIEIYIQRTVDGIVNGLCKLLGAVDIISDIKAEKPGASSNCNSYQRKSKIK